MKYATQLAALRQHDKIHGERSAEIYEVAAAIAPHVADITIVANAGVVVDSFWPNDGRYDWCEAHVNTNVTKTEIELAKPKNASGGSIRRQRFEAAFAAGGVAMGPAEFQMAALAHELGHGDHCYEYIQAANGDTTHAYEAFLAVGNSSLPLGMSSRAAQRKYALNIDGYGDQMEDAGLVGDRWRDALIANHEAYFELPVERRADEFAVRAILTFVGEL